MSEAVETSGVDEEAFYHEAALGATWTGSRLFIGALSFLFGAFGFAYFYLRSLNSHGRWKPASATPPSVILGTTVLVLILLAAVVHTVGLTRIKAGAARAWRAAALLAMGLGLAAAGVLIAELLTLKFMPGRDGFASVFTGFWPVFVVVWLGALLRLEMLWARSRRLNLDPDVPAPDAGSLRAVQRFQAALSAETVLVNYLAAVAVIAWILFYLV